MILLKVSSEASSARHLTDVARQVLNQVQYAIQNKQVHYISDDQTWQANI